LSKARELFPRNVAVTVRYAQALMQTGDPKRAHEILLDLFNVVPPTPDQARLTALAANAAGDVADSYYYMSEYHIMSGDLPLAINQLQLALQVPKITPVQRARFQARLEEVQQAMPKRMRRAASDGRSRLEFKSAAMDGYDSGTRACQSDICNFARQTGTPLPNGLN
jgi:predicted Zn-dependent protease